MAPTEVLRVSARQALEWRGTNTIADPVWAYQRYVAGKQMLFFGRTVEHSQEVCAAFRAAGVAAEHVDGTDGDPRRDGMVGAFRSKRIQVLGNCQLFDEGFDVPGCDGGVRRALHDEHHAMAANVRPRNAPGRR